MIEVKCITIELKSIQSIIFYDYRKKYIMIKVKFIMVKVESNMVGVETNIINV